jgi:soluble cytochrome b562
MNIRKQLDELKKWSSEGTIDGEPPSSDRAEMQHMEDELMEEYQDKIDDLIRQLEDIRQLSNSSKISNGIVRFIKFQDGPEGKETLMQMFHYYGK